MRMLAAGDDPRAFIQLPNGLELSGAADLHRPSNRALAASAPASC
jgi:hypothetical protein